MKDHYIKKYFIPKKLCIAQIFFMCSVQLLYMHAYYKPYYNMNFVDAARRSPRI